MLQPGDSFGDYRVLKLLGQGGMGSVYLLENAEGVQVAARSSIRSPQETWNRASGSSARRSWRTSSGTDRLPSMMRFALSTRSLPFSSSPAGRGSSTGTSSRTTSCSGWTARRSSRRRLKKRIAFAAAVFLLVALVILVLAV